MTGHMHHLNIRVTDPAASIRFYRSLGFDVVGAMMNPGVYTIYLALPDDPFKIELSVQEVPDSSWDRSAGSGHFALTVDDLDAEIARLAGLGIEPEGPPSHPGNRPDVYICFFRDPDNVRVELLNGAFPVPNDPLPAGVG